MAIVMKQLYMNISIPDINVTFINVNWKTSGGSTAQRSNLFYNRLEPSWGVANERDINVNKQFKCKLIWLNVHDKENGSGLKAKEQQAATPPSCLPHLKGGYHHTLFLQADDMRIWLWGVMQKKKKTVYINDKEDMLFCQNYQNPVSK